MLGEMRYKLTCAASYVKDRLSYKQVLVVVDEIAVRISAHRIFEHRLVNILSRLLA